MSCLGRAWAVCLVGALSCSSSDPRRSDEPSSRDAGSAQRDAGNTRDAASRDTGTRPPDPTGMTNEPKLDLVKVDACGSDNAAKLSDADVTKLKAGGAGSARLVYPYDGTVFPRGLEAPELMWDGAGGSAVYVKIRSQYYEYDGCLPSSANGTLQLPQDVWDDAGKQTLGPKTPFTIELSTLADGKVSGPLQVSLVIAQATLKGSIYYNSYNSRLGGPLAGVPDGLPSLPGGLGGNGAILRIRPGKDAEFFLRSGACVGCHTVSANGERLIAKDLGPAGLPSLIDGYTYNITPDSAPNPPTARALNNAAFTGLSPDGSVYINSATAALFGPNVAGGAGGNPPINIDSILSETDSGNAVPNSGVPRTAMMPTFAPDGSLLAFNDYASGNGAGLSLMDYDASKRVASKLRPLWTGKDGFAGWPFLLPDNGAVVFTWGASRQFTGEGVGISGLPFGGPRSDLMIVDASSGKATLLARAMGFASSADADANKTYLPYGSEELHQSYYPTVSPVAAGGYFWVFFDSVRHYGNQGMRRQLWGTAIAIQHGGEVGSADGLYGEDPSFPAFYLPGQELGTANHRAFTALDPCRADGASCETGIDCCSGFCNEGTCGEANGCSDAYESCKVDSDCCDPSLKCINNFCGQVFL